jgi:hypothetical protein
MNKGERKMEKRDIIIAVKVSPSEKALLEELATRSHRSNSNLIRHLLAEQARKDGLDWPGEGQ